MLTVIVPKVPKVPIIPRTSGGEKMNRPELHEVPLSSALASGSVNITMSAGQWDELLQYFYDAGNNLIEVDDNEVPVRAYRKQMGA